MKVVLLTLKTFSSNGGIEQVSRNWLYALSRISANSKFKFKGISMYDDFVLPEYIDENRYDVCSGNRVLFAFKSIFNCINADYVVLTHLNLSLFALIAKLINPRLKIVIQLHGIEAWKKLSGVKELALMQSNKILAVSGHTKKIVDKHYPLVQNKTLVLPNSLNPLKDYSVDFDHAILFRKKIQVEESQKLIITVGRLNSDEAYKGYDRTIEALANLNGLDFKFHIIGKYDENERERIEELIVTKNLSGKVILTGFVSDEDLDLYYQSADLFIMPSKGEGFGLVFIDAMAFGLRVVAGNKDGSVEAVQDFTESLLIDPDDTAALAKAIKTMLDMSWTIEDKMNLSNKCKSRFGPSILIKNLENVFI